MNFVGRQIETSHLDEQLNKITSSFVVIYGRRRIGKTYFVRDYCRKKNIRLLEFSGLFEAKTKNQLDDFIDRLNDLELEEEIPSTKNWKNAFKVLDKFIDRNFPNEKVVIFLDEAPWMDTGRSDFISAVGYLWEHLIQNNPNKQLIICGSAASYMLNKFVSDEGPLHARTTKLIPMKSFNLSLTREYMKLCKWQLSNRSICDLYIAAGGVAKYLSDLNKTGTPEQAISEACFSQYGKLHKEYKDLFNSLFKNAKAHYKIMDVLAQKWTGCFQVELVKKTGLAQSTISEAVSELVASGFIETRNGFTKGNKDIRLLACDMFSFFHHKWIKPNKVNNWADAASGQSYKSWAGFAFERICQLHTYQIKKKLGINGVATQTHYWDHRGDDNSEGAQIDMLLKHEDTKDIHIIECKYYDGMFSIDKVYCENLKRKIRVLNDQTSGKYNIHLVMVTTEGVAKNKYANELNFKEVILEDLFSSEP